MLLVRQRERPVQHRKVGTSNRLMAGMGRKRTPALAAGMGGELPLGVGPNPVSKGS
jgi:hypothetical protein